MAPHRLVAHLPQECEDRAMSKIDDQKNDELVRELFRMWKAGKVSDTAVRGRREPETNNTPPKKEE